MHFRQFTFLLTILCCVTFGAQSALPDLAQLKLAAERGDPQAQYEYGRQITYSNRTESFSFLLKSANQGFGLAEEAVGAGYEQQAPVRIKERASLERLAVRYTSRAAFKGIPEAQARLSRFYERGIAVPKEPFMAYGWMAVALKTAGGPKQLTALSYKSQLDQLIAKLSSEQVKTGQQFADQFRVGADNFVEIDMLVSQMKLTAFYTINGKKLTVVNQTRIAEGETKQITIDGQTVNVTCTKIDGNTAVFKLGKYEFRLNR